MSYPRRRHGQPRRRFNGPSRSCGPDWTTPTPFDAIKELNAHAGRLAAILGVILAATTFTVANGPVHDTLSSGFTVDHSVVYFMLGGTGIAIVWIALSVLNSMDPALPLPLDDKSRWTELVEWKSKECHQAARAIPVSVFWLACAWAFAIPAPGNPGLGFIGMAGGFAVFALLPVILRRFWSLRRAARSKQQTAGALPAQQVPLESAMPD